MHTLEQFSFKSRIYCPPVLQADPWIIQEHLQDNIDKINFWLGITTPNPGDKTRPCILCWLSTSLIILFSELDFKWLHHPMALGDLVICSLVGAESFQGQRQNDWAEHPAANRVTWFPFLPWLQLMGGGSLAASGKQRAGLGTISIQRSVCFFPHPDSWFHLFLTSFLRLCCEKQSAAQTAAGTGRRDSTEATLLSCLKEVSL